MNNQRYNYDTEYRDWYNEEYPQPNDSQWTIAISGGHNAAITVAKGRKVLEVIEVERFLNWKNAGLGLYKVPNDRSRIFVYTQMLADYVTKKYTDKFDYGLAHGLETYINGQQFNLHEYFNVGQWFRCIHHKSHSGGAFYQTNYQKALCISADGGGIDGCFVVSLYERGQKPKFIAEGLVDLGIPYMSFGFFLGDINYISNMLEANLVYAGKIMGLASYGNVREEWLEDFRIFYRSKTHDNDIWPIFETLANKIKVRFDINDRLTGQLAYDIAATSQRAFEDVFIEFAKPFMDQHPGLPICFTGGSALNIILNTRLVQEYGREIFVGPNPNDCGLSLGMMLDFLRPDEPFDATYCGIPILDIGSLSTYLQDRPYKYQFSNPAELAKIIADGKIVGLARGNSEHGPRALGNRSILCNPCFPNMKDVLNSKVKHREWYRPFAPLVRLEDVNKYFEWDRESRWMSFCPKVRDEYKDVLPSITHVDGTARVQTVTRDQNPFIYDLITELDKITGVGVLLNTSFNVDGKPVLSTVRDAFTILDNSDMDVLFIEDILIEKT